NSASYLGGGICNDTPTLSLTLTGCVVTGNSASYVGGGIYNSGQATVQSSTVSGNSAAVEGGGIFNDLYASLTLSGSGVTGNSAPVGADLWNLGSLTLKKSTVGVIGP